MRVGRSFVAASLAALSLLVPCVARAAEPGTLTIGTHVTIVNRWLDPSDADGLITPFMVFYVIHDALVKPMPGNINTPSLAESWSVSKDGLTYEFVLRKNAKFHNGDPVTADDVKFTFDRYRGSAAKLLKDRVKEVQTSPGRVRFVLKEPWPDFMAFFGTSATGAGWILPKKYIEKVGDDGFKKAPIGAGPYKVASFNPGVELVLEAFPEYWRKAPSVKRIVMKSIPDESTRAAALKAGEVDIAYLFSGPIASEIKKAAGFKLVAPILYGTYWLDFTSHQWDPKSPWHDRRVRLAASLAIDRKTINEVEMLGLGRPTGSFIPPEFDFALKVDPPAYDPARAKKLLAEAGYANGFDGGELTPLPPYTSLGEAVANYLQQVGIKTRVRTMERAAFIAGWREKKLHGLLIGSNGAAGNAAARLEPFVTKNGLYAYGTAPELEDLYYRQANELDRTKREALLTQLQKAVSDRVLTAPIFQQAFLCGVGPRVEESGAGLIQGFPYSAPAEDLKLKP